MSLKNNTRIKSIDIIRAIAILMVVFCHATQAIYNFQVDSFLQLPVLEQVFAITCFSIGRLGVPLFLMITGYFLLDRDYDDEKVISFYKQRLLPLFICTVCWEMIGNLFAKFYLKLPITFFTYIGQLFFVAPNDLGHMWYLPAILGIYLFIPFVAKALRAFQTKTILIPLIIVIFLIFAIVPVQTFVLYVLEKEVVIQFDLNFSGGYLGAYVILGYLLKKNIGKKFSNQFLCLCGLLFFTLGILYQVYIFQVQTNRRIWYDSPFLLITSICIFEFISRQERKNIPSFISLLSKYSFPIYLIHYFIITILRQFITPLSLLPLFKILLLFIISLLGSIPITYLLRHIPVIGPILLYERKKNDSLEY